ncbi:MAG: apolipoprotein N-acyltransferase, partial [Candidatus Omnitrophica bacterium]|nr:apolipoprotein N-acyltransferase [Candidatus Omnitrophota bacterium]
MILAIISAILLIFSFPNFNLSFFVFIGFLPLFLAIKNKSPRRAFLVSYLCGFLFYLGALYWLYHVTTFGLIILCLYLALYFGIFGFLCAFPLLQRSMISIPFIWIILEYIQAHLFTGFGWALLGYSQYKNLPLIQIADFSGVYGVSFVIMLVNVAVYRALKRSFRSSVVALLVLVMVFGYGTAKLKDKEEGKGIKISVIQGNIPQHIKWDLDAVGFIMDRFGDLSRAAALEDPNLIIWPETSFPGFFASDRRLTKEVLDLAKKIKTPLLIGANTENGIEIFNSAVLISENGEIVDKYDKIHLVPFGEYVPFSHRIPVL